jgi:hypothetical protein
LNKAWNNIEMALNSAIRRGRYYLMWDYFGELFNFNREQAALEVV